MSGPLSPMTSTKDFPFSFAGTNIGCKSFACAYKKVSTRSQLISLEAEL